MVVGLCEPDVDFAALQLENDAPAGAVHDAVDARDAGEFLDSRPRRRRARDEHQFVDQRFEPARRTGDRGLGDRRAVRGDQLQDLFEQVHRASKRQR